MKDSAANAPKEPVSVAIVFQHAQAIELIDSGDRLCRAKAGLT
jgi:hypothetical protein